MSRRSSTSGRVDHAAEALPNAAASAVKRGGKRFPSPLQRWQEEAHETGNTISEQAAGAVALYLRSSRLSRGSSASRRVEHAAEALPNAIASAVKRGEAFPLGRLSIDGSEKRARWVTISNQNAAAAVALYLRSPRLSRGFSASGRVKHAAEALPNAVASAARHGEAFDSYLIPSPLQRWQREAHERSVTSSEQAAGAVALYLRSSRLSRGSSTSGRVDHAAEALPNEVASAARRGEAFPLASPTMAAREA